MSLLHSDGFDSHAAAGTLSDGDPGWGAQTGVAVTAAQGRFGGNSLRLAGGATGGVALAPVGTNIAFAGWFRFGAGASVPNIMLADASGVLVQRMTDGSLEVYDGASNLRTSTAAGSTVDTVYAWIEVSYRSTGINVNINGVPVGTPYVGAYTAPDYPTLELLQGGAGQALVDVDDFIVWDDAGSFFNTYVLAPRRIQLLRPAADGTPVNWVPNGATNWQSVDDVDWSGGAGVVATAAGQKDRYQFTDLVVAPGSIDAVTVKTRQENTGTDPATLAHVVGQGVAEVSSTPQTISATPEVLRSTFYRDTAGAVWTSTSVNGAEFGQTLGI